MPSAVNSSARCSPSVRRTRSPSSRSSGTWWKAGRFPRQRAEDHHCRRGTVESFEQRGHAGQGDHELRHVAGALERAQRLGEQHQRGVRIAVSGMQACRVASEEAFEEVDALLAHERDALVPGRERAAHVCLREGHPRDPERVGDPVGVAERSRRRDGLLGERQCLLDATARLQTVDVRGQPVTPIAAVVDARPRR